MTAAHLYAASRTPFGKLNGALAHVRPDDLSAAALTGVLSKAPSLDFGHIGDVMWGLANGAGEDNRNVGRMAVLLAGLPLQVPGTTVNRLCGSGLDAAMMASRTIESGEFDVVIAGGVESMTRAPWVLPKPARGYPTSDINAVSTTLGWRLVNPKMPAEWTLSLGECNELLQERFDISRERQDAFATRSHALADAAWSSGFYDGLITPIDGVTLERDECIRPSTNTDKLSKLPPAFRANGTITAGNSSPLSDGASALLIGSESAADLIGSKPISRIAGRGLAATDPRMFGYAPVEAANRALRHAGISWSDVGAVEINEAFAVQSLACIDAWEINPEIVNTMGGAIAIGHPLGASGGRIIGTLAAVLRDRDERWGVAAICIGVGQGLALVLENQEASR